MRFWLTKRLVKTDEVVKDYGLCEMVTIDVITKGYKNKRYHDGYDDCVFTRKNSKFYYHIEF